MPLTGSWYVPNRVVLMELRGVLDSDGLRSGSDAIADMVENAPDGLILVRDGRGLRGLEVPAAEVARIARWLGSPKFAGMVLISDADSIHLELTGELVARVKHIHTESAATMEEVHHHLITMDPSLKGLLPDLSN